MSGVIGHQHILRELRGLALGPEPPHALLFAGPEGTGRTLLALEYAKFLNCEGREEGGGRREDELRPQSSTPCGECRPCRLIAAGAHPDIVTLAPGDTLCKPRLNESGHDRHPQSRDIRICQIRGLIELVARFPFEASSRAVLIDPADRLAREAAHTILKTLEEPPGHTVLILITSAPEAIIETVLSRCRRIDVRPVPGAEIKESLVVRGVEPVLAARAAAESRGRPGWALGFVQHPDLMDDRGRLLVRCARLAAARTKERFVYAADLAERFRRDRGQVGAELDAWEAFWEQRLRRAATEATAEAPTLSDDLQALRAIAQVREDLLAQVMPRAAFELMLLSFPRVTLDSLPEEETAVHA